MAWTRTPRTTTALAVFTAANAVWVVAVALAGLDAIYVIADALLVGTAALLLAGVHLRRPALLAAGAVGNLVFQGPFYTLDLDALTLASQAAYVVSCVGFGVAAWAWHHERAWAGTAVRVAGGGIYLACVGWILGWSELVTLWQFGNVLGALAGIGLMRAEPLVR